MQENLKAKYGITDEELKRATDQINFGKIACDGITLCALVDLVANGDIKGNAPQSKILFKSAAHEQFYNEMLAKCTYQDCYHRALMYTLGISDITRNHINEIYDFGTRCIKPNCLNTEWITSSSARAIRLAFNLFLCDIPDEESGKSSRYSVYDIFSYGDEDKEYYFQAIKLRFDF